MASKKTFLICLTIGLWLLFPASDCRADDLDEVIDYLVDVRREELLQEKAAKRDAEQSAVGSKESRPENEGSAQPRQKKLSKISAFPHLSATLLPVSQATGR